MTTAVREPRLDVLTMGRCGVDIYPLQSGIALEDVETFGRFLGGSSTNVAVAAARLGLRSAVITGVGDDPFGCFVRREIRALGVSDRYAIVTKEFHTPVTFCEIFPPDDFPLWFYRSPTAPDLQLSEEDLDFDAIVDARLFWTTVTGLSEDPSRRAHLAALQARARQGLTVLDLDYRPTFWKTPGEAAEQVQTVLPYLSVVVGNEAEYLMSTGESAADRAADAVLDAGVELAVVKRGPRGALAKTRTERVEIPSFQVDVVNGLGAGDGFGGALCFGLLRDWDLRRTIRFASAAGAIVATRLECARAMPSVAEIDALLDGNGANPTATLADTLRIRTIEPARVAKRLAARLPAPRWADPAKNMLLIAADHPARGAFAAGRNPLAMADRGELIDRIVIALGRPGVHGFLGTADLVEDLTLLGALDGKIVFGSMNRGGLAGSAFEIDDRFTGYDARGIAESRLDGGKMLLRIDPTDPASATTLEACSQAVDELGERKLRALVEPFMSERHQGRVRNVLTPEAVMTAIAVAAGLGRTSAYTWLKLPVVADMERVMSTSPLPALILGGEVSADPDAALANWARSLAIPNVQGLIIGRSLLYPPGDDVAAVVDAVVELL